MTKTVSFLLTALILLGVLVGCNSSNNGGSNTGETARRVTGDEVAQRLKGQGLVEAGSDFKKDKDQTFQTRSAYSAKVSLNNAGGKQKEYMNVTYTVDHETQGWWSASVYYSGKNVKGYFASIKDAAKKIMTALDSSLQEQDKNNLIEELLWKETDVAVSKNNVCYIARKTANEILFLAEYDGGEPRTGQKIEVDKATFDSNLIKAGFVKKKAQIKKNPDQGDGADDYTLAFKDHGTTYVLNYVVLRSNKKVIQIWLYSGKTGAFDKNHERVAKKVLSAAQIKMSEEELKNLFNWLYKNGNNKNRSVEKDRISISGGVFVSGSGKFVRFGLITDVGWDE